MSKLTKEKEAEFQEAFTINDKDCDGKVNFEEFAKCVRSIGLSPTQAELYTLRNEVDRDSTRGWNLNEAKSLIGRLNSTQETADSLTDAFRIFDNDGNGYIMAAELRHVLTHLGEKLSDVEVDEMIREACIEKDGQVNYKEFVKILTHCG